MTFIHVLTEGQVIPSGFSIKIGFMHRIDEQPKRFITQGRDGLVETVMYDYAPLSHDETRPWATLMFQLGKFRVSYRIRSWAPNIFRIGYNVC